VFFWSFGSKWVTNEDRNLARKRPGDLTPIEREAMLFQVNAHLEKLLAKANKEKDML